MWCVAEIDEDYVANMEDVLATYERPLSYKDPVVCLDEKPLQLLKNINSTSRLVGCRKPRRKDHEYKRMGTANAFCIVEPKRGRYMVKITKYREADQFGEAMRDIGRAYPAASKIHLVLDKLSNHAGRAVMERPTLPPRRRQGTKSKHWLSTLGEMPTWENTTDGSASPALRLE